MVRYSTIVISGDEDVSLLPYSGEKHICILFFIRQRYIKNM